jgi:hypothetical protein
MSARAFIRRATATHGHLAALGIATNTQTATTPTPAEIALLQQQALEGSAGRASLAVAQAAPATASVVAPTTQVAAPPTPAESAAAGNAPAVAAAQAINQSASGAPGEGQCVITKPVGIVTSAPSVDGTTTLAGAVVGKATGLAVGAAASSALISAAGGASAVVLGATAGSVFPIVGTVIGAAIGFLTQGLFGKANYGAIYSIFQNQLALVAAYMQVAGQYPGRVYGAADLQTIWYGMQGYGLWPGNGPANPPCTEADLQSNIHACGTGQWVSDVFAGTGIDAINTWIAKANQAGVCNPIDVCDEYWTPQVEAPCNYKNCDRWYAPSASRNASLMRQLVIDTIDCYEYMSNSALPVYYGSIPSASEATQAVAQSLPAAQQAAQAAAAVASAQAAQSSTATIGPSSQQLATQAAYSPIGASIQGGVGGQLTTPAGVFTFGGSPNGNGDYPAELQGALTGYYGSVMTYQVASPVTVTVQSKTGAIYQYSAGVWTQTAQANPAQTVSPSDVASATPGTPAMPAEAAAGTQLQAGTSAVLSTPQGDFMFSPGGSATTDTTVLWSINGVNYGATTGAGILLEYTGSAVLLATEEGAVYQWVSGAWEQIQGSSAAEQVPTGWEAAGTDPTTGNPVYLDPANGLYYEYENGAWMQYQSAASTAAIQPYATTSEGTPAYTSSTPSYASYTAPATAAAPATTASTGISTTTLFLIGGAALGAVLLLSDRGGGRGRSRGRGGGGSTGSPRRGRGNETVIIE